jgi:uncharacterized protein (DUF2267 family)
MDEYGVTGGLAGPVPGVQSPRDLDGRAEWAPLPDHRRLPLLALLEELRARLGSEVDERKVVLGVLCPLGALLEGEPLESILAHLPFPYTREVLEAEWNLNAEVHAPAGAGDYLVEAAELLQQPPARAAATVRAFFGAARAVLRPDEAEAIAARLPRDLAAVWALAR